MLLTTDGQKRSDFCHYRFILPGYSSGTTSTKFWMGALRPPCRLLPAFFLDRELSEISLILPNNRKRAACHLRSQAPFEPEKHGHSYWQMSSVLGEGGWRKLSEGQEGSTAISFHLESPWQQITSPSFLHLV